MYSAPLLASTCKNTKAKILSFHSKIMRILNIKSQDAAKHKVQDVHNLIDDTCCTLLKRIKAEPDHPITVKTPSNNMDKDWNHIDQALLRQKLMQIALRKNISAQFATER